MLRFLRAARPLLTVTLLVGAAVFAPADRMQRATPAQQPTTATTSADASRTAAGTEAQNTANGDLGSTPPSILAEIFGATAVDPLFKLPGTSTENENAPAAPSGAQEPEREPAKSIYRYLIATSEIGFKSDTSRLSLALATAEQGDTKTLDGLIADWQEKLGRFREITPPPELREIHAESVAVIERYLKLLSDARDHAGGGVQAIWASPERRAIGQEADRIAGKLRDLVHSENIVLPDGVLP